MRKYLIVAVLIMFSLVSCRKERLDMDLLYGSWILESNAGHPRPMVDFNTGGDYCMVDYTSVPFGGTTVYGYEITGEFSIRDNLVTFLTANVESLEDGTGGTEFPYEGVAVSGGSPLGSFYSGQSIVSPHPGGDFAGVPDLEYKPVAWEIISLTGSILEVKEGIETFRYVRR